MIFTAVICLQYSFTFETKCSNILEIQNTNYPAWLIININNIQESPADASIPARRKNDEKNS